MTTNLPEKHFRLGEPSKVYPYKNINGDIYAAVYRFDGSGGKTYRPFDAIQESWSFPENVGPYGLENFQIIPDEAEKAGSANPEKSGIFPDNPVSNPEFSAKFRKIPDFPVSPVIIVEGEKCVDALTYLGFLAISSMGGSNQAGKTDWSCLKGRDVFIWPDNDPAGLKYSEAVKDTLRNVGIKSLRICYVTYEILLKAVSVTLGRDNLLKQNNGGLLKESEKPLTDIDNLLKGWDVADALKEGWRHEHIETFLKEAGPIEITLRKTSLRNSLSNGDNFSIENISIETPANDNGGDNWGEPDLSILSIENPPPKFPIEIFNPQIADWLLKSAEGRAAPVDYVAGTLMSVSAALIGNSRKVSPWEGWCEPSILWLALVGDPSSGKSPAMDPVIDILKSLEDLDIPNFEEALRDYETKKITAEAIKADWEAGVQNVSNSEVEAEIMPNEAIAPDEPQRPRLVIRDATTEALALALQGQPKGLLMHRDELAGWFANFDRYSGGKGGDRAFWLECYGGKSFTQDRVKNGIPRCIPNLSASIIGSIQPDRLETCLMKGDDDGLNSRFMYIYPNKCQRRRPRALADDRSMERALTKLHGLQMDMTDEHSSKGRIISLSSDASELFDPWWVKKGGDDLSGKSSGWHGKTQGMALRLALVLTYLNWATGYDAPEPFQVDTETILNAMNFIDDYLTPMAERAFGIGHKTEADQNVITLATWIQDTKPERFSVRDLQRSGTFPNGTKADAIKIACLRLVGLNWLRADYVRKGDNAGRQQTAFIVNPLLLREP